MQLKYMHSSCIYVPRIPYILSFAFAVGGGGGGGGGGGSGQWVSSIERVCGLWPGQLSSLWRIFVPKVGAEGVEEVRVERDRDTAPGASAGGSACGRAAWMALTGVGMGNGTWTWGERVPVPTACCFPFPPAPAPTPTPPPPPTPAPTPTPAPPTPTPTPPLLALLALRLLSDTHGLNSHVLF